MRVSGGRKRASGGEKGSKPVPRTAEEPQQTLNIDLCFVPASHEQAEHLPAVSGSSGRLRFCGPAPAQGKRTWPGRVFEDVSLSYEEAMQRFVAASREQEQRRKDRRRQGRVGQSEEQKARAAIRCEETQLRDARRRVREQRQVQDAAWRAFRAERKAAWQAYRALPEKAKSQLEAQHQAEEVLWRTAWQQRQQRLATRQVEDAAWRQARELFRSRWQELPASTIWIAILVVIDNCTRQCLGLPLFVTGVKVTATAVAEALSVLLPAELQFLISDRGSHFTASDFEYRFLSEHFIHVYAARHRPESNGIAERFVRTIKEWLETKCWDGDQDLDRLLDQFHLEYNDRPHQGLPIPGLSPNEFAKRMWLL